MKKFISLLFAVLICVSFLSVPVFAEINKVSGMKGEKETQPYDMTKEMMSMMKDMMGIMKDMQHVPTPEQKQKLGEMMKKIGSMMKKREEMK